MHLNCDFSIPTNSGTVRLDIVHLSCDFAFHQLHWDSEIKDIMHLSYKFSIPQLHWDSETMLVAFILAKLPLGH
jgi:hypothetical protein